MRILDPRPIFWLKMHLPDDMLAIGRDHKGKNRMAQIGLGKPMLILYYMGRHVPWSPSVCASS